MRRPSAIDRIGPLIAAENRRGVALVIVMVVVMLLALASYGYNHQMVTAYRLSRLQSDRVQARLAALSGIEAMAALVESTPDVRAGRIEDPATFRGELESGGTSGGTMAALTIDDEPAGWSFAILAPRLRVDGDDDGGSATGGGGLAGESAATWRFGLVNESAKLNVDALRQQDAVSSGHARRALLGLPGATPSDVDAFLRIHGIVDPRSRVRDLLEQLQEKGSGDTGGDPNRRLAKLWTGGDWDHNYRIGPLERLAAESGQRRRDVEGSSNDLASSQEPSVGATRVGDESAPPAWRDYVTFQSGRRNVNRFGRPRIYLNAADLRVLHGQLAEVWPTEWADFVVLARQHGLSQPSAGESPSRPGGPEDSEASGSSDGAEIDWALPPRFAFASAMEMIDQVVSSPSASGSIRTIPSPWRDTRDGWGDYLERLVDDVTTDPSVFVNGQIDVTQAPLEVLMGVPGMTRSAAERIIEARRGVAAIGSTRDSVAWLVLQDVTDLATLRQWFPWITVGGDCYSGQAIGFRDSTSPVFRCTFVIDGRRGPIRSGTNVGGSGATFSTPARPPSGVVRVDRFQHWHSWGRGFELGRLRTTP
jgi:hypothetical protein